MGLLYYQFLITDEDKMNHNIKVGQKYSNGVTELEILFVGDKSYFCKYKNPYRSGEAAYHISDMISSSMKLVAPKIKKYSFCYKVINSDRWFVIVEDDIKSLIIRREWYINRNYSVTDVKEIEFDQPEPK